MPDEPLHDVVQNIMDEDIPQEVQKRLLEPLLTRIYPPTAPARKMMERRRNAILEEYDPIPPQRIRTVTDYQNEILGLFAAGEFEGEEKEGRRFIRWRFIRGLERDLTPNFMIKLQERATTAFYLRYIYSYQIRHIEDGTVMVYHKNFVGSPWINRLSEAGGWLSEQEKKRLDLDNIARPNTKWEFVSFFNVDVKVVLDRQPLLGTGPLPEWLRNLARGRAGPMVARTYRDNLCLWRCIAVHHGVRLDRSTQAAGKEQGAAS